MATKIITEYSLRPLPKLYKNPTTRIPISSFPTSIKLLPSKHLRPNFPALKVSTPVGVQIVDKDEERVNEFKVQESEFDPGAAPPFTLADIRAAIPKHCWVKDPWRSMSYVVRDVVLVFGLAAVAAYLNNMVVWPLYWFAQGTMFWALFVLGHDW
ncbi:hypothetical protein M8C21_030228 [Ambrosia artemisiifolia]|uniref:Fatty acid desaturase N-terminal domain-containing protein n=1 Tax=Ambrosia artemisiifolia TaxID=4212 RepID=A0AAD5C8X2_AMBAR|nr:hypothetical protein M8C21_030228 [Ambrosia artemisiifolia]